MAKRRYWTEQEINYLEKFWGKKSIDQIAKSLNRTTDAVTIKASKLGLGTLKDNIDGIPMTMLPEIIGVPYCSIRKTWKNAGLKTKHCGNNLEYVDEKELYRFMKEHPNLWDARKCDYYYFYSEPWFIQALENERNGNHARRYHKWTEHEKARFIFMREQKGMYFSEIAEVFGISKKNAWKRYNTWKKQQKSEVDNG